MLKKYICQRRFFGGGKGGQASLTFYQITNKIISVLISDFVSYMKMSRLIKQEKFSYLYVSNRKCHRSDKELVAVELISRWPSCLQVGNRGKFLLGYHGNSSSTNKKADLFCLYIQYRSYVRRLVCQIPPCKELPWKQAFCSV